MALEVWKYEVPGTSEFILNMPDGAHSLTVAWQPTAAAVMLWALVNPEHTLCERRFKLTGTGQLMAYEPDELRFIGSFQLEGGALIFHLFEIMTGPF